MIAAPTPTRDDSGICTLRWCDETELHAGPHRTTIADALAINIGTGRRAIVQINLQGESARTRAVVLVVDGHEVGLTWPQVRSLSTVLARALARYGPAKTA